MQRRDFLTGLAGAPLAMAGALRAHAQGTPAVELTYGQSVGVVTLDPAHGCTRCTRQAARPRFASTTGC